MNLNLRKEKIFKGELAYLSDDLGRSCLNLGIWRAKTKYFQGTEDVLGILGDYCIILGSKVAQTHWGPRYIY